MRKYSAEERTLFNLYVDELVEMVFLKELAQALWQAAPQLAPKDSKSKFWSTIDLRTVNAARKRNSAPFDSSRRN